MSVAITVTPEFLIGSILRETGGAPLSSVVSLPIPAGSLPVLLKFEVPENMVYLPVLYRMTIAPDGKAAIENWIDDQRVHQDGYVLSSTYSEWVPFVRYGYPIEAHRYLAVKVTPLDPMTDIVFSYWGIGVLLPNEVYRRVRDKYWRAIARWLES
ncbi:MAG: hypothetical protein DRO14_04700 [Thermoprotei archaeon]|nr:MAG: hypothetical protein DRO14_04700 [Thermoprotei archaeon]